MDAEPQLTVESAPTRATIVTSYVVGAAGWRAVMGSTKPVHSFTGCPSGSMIQILSASRPCACNGEMGGGGKDDDALHTPEFCHEKYAGRAGEKFHLTAIPCRCLLPSCRACSSRPDIERERALAMLLSDAARAGERLPSPNPIPVRHYSPDWLMGGIIRIR